MALTWTGRTSPFDAGQARRGCYAADRDEYVACGDIGPDGQEIVTSPDGTTWTAQFSPFDSSTANAVARSLTLGLYVAVGYAAGTIATSPDGATWDDQGNPFGGGAPTGLAVAVKEGASPVVMVGGGSMSTPPGEVIATSTDGLVWTLIASPFDGGRVVGIAYSSADDRWVACGSDASFSPAIAHSDDDGATWVTDTNPLFFMNDVYRDDADGLWYVVGGTDTTNVLAVSSDGSAWTVIATPFDGLGGQAFGVGTSAAGTLVVVGYNAVTVDLDAKIIESIDGGTNWMIDASPFDAPYGGGEFALGVFASDALFVALGTLGTDGVAIATADDTPPPPDLPTPNGLKNTWRWVVTDLASHQKAFLDRLATNVGIDYILDDSSVMTCDLPSDQPDVYEITAVTAANPYAGPRVDYGHRLLYGLRREEPPGGPPWVCRFAGIITILQDQATADEPVTHMTAHDPWTWAKTLPVLNIDGSLLGPDGLDYEGKTGDYIVRDLIANAYTWIAATYDDPMPWNNEANDGQHLPIDIDGGHFDTTSVIPKINFAQGTSVGDAWTQICQTGTVDILLQPVFGANPGVVSILNVYAQAGKQRHGAVFGWDMFPHNCVAVDDLRDGTLIENVAQFWAGNNPADQETDTDSLDKYGPYFVQKNYPAPANPAAVSLLALAEVALRKQGKRTVLINPMPELAPDPFTIYYLGDQVPLWAGRPLPPSGNALRGGIRSEGEQLGLRVYGFHVDLADDQQETIQGVLLTDPNESV